MAAVVRSHKHNHYNYYFITIIILSLLPISLSVNNQEALRKFKSSLNDSAGDLISWNQNTFPCDPKAPWRGVLCFNGIVAGLRLSQMQLSGTIDVDALTQLPGLRTISIVNNSFTGPIPQFNKLGALKTIFLSKNQFSGEIPSDFFLNMESLKKIWVSGNKFSGKIPSSLAQIPHLIELHLEYNEFTGPIPALAQPSLSSLDMSHNKLEGEIPASLSKFGIRSFQGNEGLCGKSMGKECELPLQPPIAVSTPSEESSKAAPPPPSTNQNQEKSKIGWWLIMGVAVGALVLILLLRSKQREDRFVMLGKENLDEVVEVRIPSSNHRKSMNLSRKGHGSSARRGSQRGGRLGDLVIVNDEKGEFGMSDLMKAAAEVLGNGGLGSAYKAMLGNGVSVVVKRIREMNKMTRDAFDTEIRRLGRLKHPNILTPLAYHFRKEEKLLVSEFVPKGSLLYILHGDRGVSHTELNWPRRVKIIQGVAQGLGFLHKEFGSYELPHGNLKSSNILLGSSYEPLLSDYAFYPLMNNTQAVQVMFAYKSPEAILYQQVSHKSDVFCLGIVILEILTGKFPSQYLSNQKGGTDVVQWVRTAVAEKRETELIDPEIGDDDPNSVQQMAKLLQIGADCTEGNPDERMDLKEAISRIEQITV